MDDLISRQALCEYALNQKDKSVTPNDIMRFPSTQPERKNGKWIRHDEVKNVYGGTCVECSECGEKYVVQYIEDEKYCRNCGAKMGDNE